MDLLGSIVIWIVALLVLVFSGMPVVFALGVVGVCSVSIAFGSGMWPSLGRVAWQGLNSFSIAAIPLFVFMGYLLHETNLSQRIYAGLSPFIDRILPGGLLHTNIAVSAAFAACSGSSLASCATIASIALPEMEKLGYDRKISVGSVAAGGTLGILIPPSITLIIYGLQTGESVGKLFLAGVVPGLILTLSYMAYIVIRLAIHPELGNVRQKEPWGRCLLLLLRAWPVLVLVLGVIGSIYLGWATPTEAATVGCFLVIIIAVVYRQFSRGALARAITATVITSSMIICIYLSGQLATVFLSNAGITRGIADFVTGLDVAPVFILIGIIVMYLLLGMLIDGISIMIMTIPVVVPVVAALGCDTIWFGIILTMLIEAALLTPPVGFNLFVIQSLRPDYPFMDIVRGCFPFFIVLMIIVALLTVFPQLALWLPQML